MGRQTTSFIHDGYRVYLPDGTYGYISFDKRSINLQRVNKLACGCASCGRAVQPGTAVFHNQYGRQGYICLICVKGIILEQGARGYSENAIMNLQCRYDSNGNFSARQVADSIALAYPVVIEQGAEYRRQSRMQKAARA